ncbi:MAG TPA: cobalamin biosynthesis protein CbiG [Caulobacteraceae bacterium]|nr:cobalamin biosynthesis protein CbiG [Caulobacteraceae bacterium]
MARLFKAYVIVRWSAASKPTAGNDAVWIGVLKPDVRFRLAFEAHNPTTRAQAEKLLAQILDDRIKRRERTLVGFEFPLGFPRGLAAGLKLPGDQPWRAVWDQLGKMVKDKADNTNNRFGVGSEINRRLTGGPFPFWGVPPKDALTTLQPKRGREHGKGDLPEFRYVEAARGGAQPVWKLYYNGAVGPLGILGIPMVRRLREAHGAMRVWPFETGFKAHTETDLAGVDLVAAEVSPAGVTSTPLPGEAKETAVVRQLAEHFARLDEAGRLGAAFAPAKDVAPEAVRAAEAEEGWALGA